MSIWRRRLLCRAGEQGHYFVLEEAGAAYQRRNSHDFWAVRCTTSCTISLPGSQPYCPAVWKFRALLAWEYIICPPSCRQRPNLLDSTCCVMLLSSRGARLPEMHFPFVLSQHRQVGQ